MRALKQERDMLLDRIADMEAENLANVARSDRLLAELSAEKRHLQRQLHAAVATSSHRQLLVEQQPNDIGVTPLTPSDYLKQEDGYRIPPRLSTTNDTQDGFRIQQRLSSTNNSQDGFRITQRVSTTSDTQDGFRIPSRLSSTNDNQNDDYRVPPRLSTTNDQQDGFRIPSRLSSTNDQPNDGFRISSRLSSTNENQDDGYRIRPTDPVSQRLLSDGGVTPPSRSGQRTGRIRVGALDGIVSSPSPRMKGARDVTPDKKKTAAILAEFNVVELQRHLLVTTFQNQVS
ncbi:hypothetical protein LSTR_LSTR016910 [Laodelphax striatellus]|uniref:Uncharacterized protein n=1 Tax=Laodelphax striatellus TaxID=195883 RepID=A0A482XCW2_LAOST|nr:hypothetical protein LSTR_LSTR016910 [Laodelphax striatellus]